MYSVGLHAGSPFFRFIKFLSVCKTLYYEDEKCVSKDGIMVTFKLDVQYQVGQGGVRDLVAQYSTAEKHVKILYWAIQSGVHNTCSQFLITEFQEERGRVQDSLLAKCRAKAESLMTQVIDVQLQNIDIPGEYTMAIESKERAREDINLAYNERAQLVYEGERRRQESKQDILIMTPTRRAMWPSRTPLPRARLPRTCSKRRPPRTRACSRSWGSTPPG